MSTLLGNIADIGVVWVLSLASVSSISYLVPERENTNQKAVGQMLDPDFSLACHEDLKNAGSHKPD